MVSYTICVALTLLIVLALQTVISLLNMIYLATDSRLWHTKGSHLMIMSFSDSWAIFIYTLSIGISVVHLQIVNNT